jgi:UDP-N-acetylmuramate--alanine ligase
MNARAAKSAVRVFAPSIKENEIDESLTTFTGTWRRFEFKGTTAKGALVYDDYAHHPTAIRVTLEAVRERFPNKKIVVAFHPHLYSRTRDLMEEFADAFSEADFVAIAPIYPAREDPIPGVTSHELADKISMRGKSAQGFDSLKDVELYLKTVDAPDVILFTMGAGDIYKIVSALLVL